MALGLLGIADSVLAQIKSIADEPLLEEVVGDNEVVDVVYTLYPSNLVDSTLIKNPEPFVNEPC